MSQQDLVAAVETSDDCGAVDRRRRRSVVRLRREAASPRGLPTADAVEAPPAAEWRRRARPPRPSPVTAAAAARRRRRRRRCRGARPGVVDGAGGGRMKDDSRPAGPLRGEDVGQRRGRRGAGRRRHGVDEERRTMTRGVQLTGGARRPLRHVVLSQHHRRQPYSSNSKFTPPVTQPSNRVTSSHVGVALSKLQLDIYVQLFFARPLPRYPRKLHFAAPFLPAI